MDETDELIVELLEADGRLTHREVADTIGLSRSATAARIQQLLASGRVVVRGVVHPAVLGRHHLSHIAIEVQRDATRVASHVAGLDDVAFVSLTSGRHAVVAELRAGSLGAIDAAMTELRSLPTVLRIESLTYREVVRDVVGPVGHVEADVDAADLRLLELLQQDGRITYTALAGLLDLSPTTVRRRVRSLRQRRLLRIGTLVRQSGHDRQAMMGLGVNLSGPAGPVIQALSALAQVTFVARVLGRFDMLLSLRALTSSELVDVIETIRGTDGVRYVESWTHLRVVKETYAQPPLVEP